MPPGAPDGDAPGVDDAPKLAPGLDAGGIETDVLGDGGRALGDGDAAGPPQEAMTTAVNNSGPMRSVVIGQLGL